MKRSKYWLQHVNGVRVEFRTYVKWSTLPRVVLYTGPMANGKTLSAIRQLVESKDDRRIVSNTHLFYLDYKFDSFRDVTNLVEYTGNIYLIDSAYVLADSRRGVQQREHFIVQWLQMARKLDNRVIITMSNPDALSRYIRDCIGAIFVPEFFYNKYKTPKVTLRRYYYNWRGKVAKIVIYPTVNARKYFKYFDTEELPYLEELLKEKN